MKIYSTGIGMCSNSNDEYLIELIIELAKNRVKTQYVPLSTKDRHQNFIKKKEGRVVL